MEIIPSSTLYLCENIDLDPNYNYTMDFDTIEAQEAYFNSKIYTDFEANEDYQYIRDTRAVKVPANINDLLNINYLFFNNGNKRYYAFIIRKDYIHANCTALTFKIDVMQTFMFDYEIDESFVEREHQDRFNENLKPIFNNELENVDYGRNYKLKSCEKIISKNNYTTNQYNIAWAVLVCNDKLTNDSLTNASCLDNYYYYAVPLETPSTSLTGLKFYDLRSGNYTQLENAMVICKIIASNYASKITAIKLYDQCPFFCRLRDYNGGVSVADSSTKLVTVDGHNLLNVIGTIEKTIYGNDSLRELKTYNLSLISSPITLDISNNKNINYETKLYTDPYYFMLLTNHNGDGLKIEPKGLADVTKIPIYYIPVCSPDSKIMYYVKNYYGDNEGRYYNYIDNSVNEIGLTSDKWQDYLAQNKASAVSGVAVNMGTSIATTAIGAITANPLAIAGGILSLGKNIADTIIKQEDIKQSPNSAKSQGNNSSFTMSREIIGLELEIYTITDNFKQKLFNYFYHYGYKCNDFKKPNIRSRYYFNYIKTIGANIKGNIDGEFKTNIMEIYDKGITIWHYRNSLTFKGVNNYDYENVEMNLMEE